MLPQYLPSLRISRLITSGFLFPWAGCELMRVRSKAGLSDQYYSHHEVFLMIVLDARSGFWQYGREQNTTTFNGIAARYRKEIFPTKAPQTQRDNEKELSNLEAVFGSMPIDAIQPKHIKQYLMKRGETAPVRANREKALFCHQPVRRRAWTQRNRP